MATLLNNVQRSLDINKLYRSETFMIFFKSYCLKVFPEIHGYAQQFAGELQKKTKKKKQTASHSSLRVQTYFNLLSEL